ncbi:MAG: hypothetical protein LC774_13555 [Acidobacteria bacterium]|nr:hypothetical protein [Acidobacteriota bacterium]
MQSVTPHPAAPAKEPPDPAREAERLAALLAERRAELTNLQESLRDFKTRYAEQDRLYRLMLEADEAATAGHDRLADEARRLDRKIVKTRNRLAHLS